MIFTSLIILFVRRPSSVKYISNDARDDFYFLNSFVIVPQMPVLCKFFYKFFIKTSSFLPFEQILRCSLYVQTCSKYCLLPHPASFHSTLFALYQPPPTPPKTAEDPHVLSLILEYQSQGILVFPVIYDLIQVPCYRFL